MPPLTAEQLAMRSGPDGFVGASEIAAIVGCSRWAKPIDIWLRKTGRAADELSSPLAAVGLRAEDTMLTWYAEDTGRAREEFARGESTRHPEHRFAGCTPDYLLVTGGRLVRLVQMKCVGAFMSQFWPEDGVPADVECQVQYEMECLDVGASDVVAWLGGTDFRIIELTRDREFGAMLIRGAASFWKCVTEDLPPPVDGSENWRQYLQQRFPVVEREELDMSTAEVDRWAQESLRAREKIDELKADQDAADNHLRLLIGERLGFLGLDYRVTWAADKNGKRTLRIKRRNNPND